MNAFLLGALMTAYLALAVRFVTYWRRSGDRLFAIFAAAFAILAMNQLAFVWIGEAAEASTGLYLVRLAAYVTFLVAIADRNLRD